MKYEVPKVFTYGSQQLVAMLGPNVSCSAFAGSVRDQRGKR